MKSRVVNFSQVIVRVPPRFFVAGQVKSKSGRFTKSGRNYAHEIFEEFFFGFWL